MSLLPAVWLHNKNLLLRWTEGLGVDSPYQRLPVSYSSHLSNIWMEFHGWKGSLEMVKGYESAKCYCEICPSCIAMVRCFLPNSPYLENLESSSAPSSSSSPISNFLASPPDSPLWHLVFSSHCRHPNPGSHLTPVSPSTFPSQLLRQPLCCSLLTPATPPSLSGFQSLPSTLPRPPPAPATSCCLISPDSFTCIPHSLKENRFATAGMWLQLSDFFFIPLTISRSDHFFLARHGALCRWVQVLQGNILGLKAGLWSRRDLNLNLGFDICPAVWSWVRCISLHPRFLICSYKM